MNRRGYEPIDDAIDEWVARHQLNLLTSVEGIPDQVFRTVYLSSDSGECFQIWIDPPEAGQVSLHAANVETRDDEEFREDWRFPISEFSLALDLAVHHVHDWMNRK